ncbi:MAG: nucleoside-diphosphate kinase [Candidatus Freyarchaeota archaeon]|nr:nucleoside-diphosphate kinase [Candidatus Jordarchaeia archaeon]
MEATLVILKPDATVRSFVGAYTTKVILDQGYRVTAFKWVQVTGELAEKHYEEHAGKPFFNWLTTYIKAAPVVAMKVEGENVIQGIRRMLGATMAQKAEPETIRGKYGIWGGVNVAHASDSPETAKRELALWLTKAGLKENENGQEKAEEYAKSRQATKDYTKKLRETCKALSERRVSIEHAREAIKQLLTEENPNAKPHHISNLTEAIIQNFLLP